MRDMITVKIHGVTFHFILSEWKLQFFYKLFDALTMTRDKKKYFDLIFWKLKFATNIIQSIDRHRYRFYSLSISSSHESIGKWWIFQCSEFFDVKIDILSIICTCRSSITGIQMLRSQYSTLECTFKVCITFYGT